MTYSLVTFCRITTFHLLGMKRKRKNDMPSEILEILGRLDEAADSRMEERGKKRMLLQDRLERNRQEEERWHELNVQQMMFTFIQQMTVPHMVPPTTPNYFPPQPPYPHSSTPTLYPFPNILNPYSFHLLSISPLMTL